MADRTIYITGLAPVATEKDLKDLFSFCGNLLRITIRSGGGDTNEALIEFDAAAALDMALQFSNALVKGKTIMVFPYSESPESKLGLDQKKQPIPVQNSPKSSPVGSPPSSLSMSPPKNTTVPSPESTSAPKTNPNTAMLVEPKKVSRSIIDEDVFNFDDLPPKSTEPSSTGNTLQGDDFSNKNTNEQPSSPSSSNYNSMSPSTLSPRDSLNFERLSLSSRTVLITNLCPDLSLDLFFKFFDFCGPMLSYSIDKESQSGLIEFRSHRAIKIASHLNQCNLGSKRVQIEPFDLNKHAAYFEKLAPHMQQRPSMYDDNFSDTVSPSTSPGVNSMLATSPPKHK